MNVHEMHRAFMENVEIEDEDSCWIWTGFRTTHGYGRFSYRGLKVRANRFAASGFRMPVTKMFACHRCDNPPCVNPDHLFFARPVDNTLDMIQKGRRVQSNPTSETSRHRKLTRDQVREIRSAYAAGGVTYQDLGHRYGVTKQAIYYVVKEKVWRDNPA